MEAGARTYLAMILELAGRHADAEREAIVAAEIAANVPPIRAQALATLARVRLSEQCHSAALDAATEALQLLESIGGVDEGESLIRLVYAEALRACGQPRKAKRAIAAAHTRLLDRAKRISRPAWRQSFLHRVPENARTLELAQAWLDEQRVA